MNDQKLNSIGEIKDLVAQTQPHTDPFLYYLPTLLTMKDFENIHSGKLTAFVKEAVLYERKPIIRDAMNVLNKLVDPNDGTLLTPTPAHYYENYSFSWKELGERKNVIDVIMHILNKSLFQLSLGM